MVIGVKHPLPSHGSDIISLQDPKRTLLLSNQRELSTPHRQCCKYLDKGPLVEVNSKEKDFIHSYLGEFSIVPQHLYTENRVIKHR